MEPTVALRLQAQIAVTAKHVEDPRYALLVEQLAARTGQTPAAVEENIARMAQGLYPVE